MPMPDYTDIVLAVRKKVRAVSDIPNDNSFWFIDTKFDPPDQDSGLMWIQEALLIAGEQHTASKQVTTTGQVRYNLYYDFGRDVKRINALAAGIRNALKPSQSVTHNGVVVSIYRTEQLGGRQDSIVWWMVPVLIYFRVHSDIS